MSSRGQIYLDVFLTIIGGLTGLVSTLDSIEQIGRILLLFISILSGVFLILINWDKAIQKIKSFFK